LIGGFKKVKLHSFDKLFWEKGGYNIFGY